MTPLQIIIITGRVINSNPIIITQLNLSINHNEILFLSCCCLSTNLTYTDNVTHVFFFKLILITHKSVFKCKNQFTGI